MSNLHNERFDEIKSLIKKSKMLLEQSQINVAQDIEDRLQNDEDEFNQEYDTDNNPTGKEKSKKDKSQKYRISGGILSLHGKNRDQLDITSDEKIAFQETMDEFVEEVSDLVDFNTLNVYPNNVEWSGKLIDEDLDFIFTIGEDSGIYINGEMIKVDPEFMDTLIKLQKYYQKFKSKWGKVLASRKKTKELPD
jgi:hypothetical protein